MGTTLPKTIREAHDALVKHEYSAVGLLESFQKHIGKEEPRLHAFLYLTLELAQAQALEVDRKLANNEPIGALEGIPCAIKDNILVEGEPCTAGSKILENYRAACDATAVEKLKAAGAVMVGKTNLDEFAMGSSTENSAYGPTKNPHDETRVPGGSSGGSAAAVAAGEVVYALGSDTGGSIRQPAGFCGVVGLKPTYGSVSRYGLIAMASSLDVIGPLANTVEDVEIVFNAIRGKDPLDATTAERVAGSDPTTLREKIMEMRGLRVGLPKEYFIEGMEPEVENAVRAAAKKFESFGVRVEEISLPHSQHALAAYYIIVPAEISANLARYDGLRFGKVKSKNEKGKSLFDAYYESRSFFGPEVRRRIMLGTYVLSHGYYDAYYKKALAVRALIRQDFEEAFKKVDVLLTPVSPTLPFKFGEKTADPLQMYLSDIFTVPINLAGVPAMSMNCGWQERDGKQPQTERFVAPSTARGERSEPTTNEVRRTRQPCGVAPTTNEVRRTLPIGMQLIAPWFGEDVLFTLGKAFESAS